MLTLAKQDLRRKPALILEREDARTVKPGTWISLFTALQLRLHWNQHDYNSLHPHSLQTMQQPFETRRAEAYWPCKLLKP